jgi:hypothetical protein
VFIFSRPETVSAYYRELTAAEDQLPVRGSHDTAHSVLGIRGDAALSTDSEDGRGTADVDLHGELAGEAR